MLRISTLIVWMLILSQPASPTRGRYGAVAVTLRLKRYPKRSSGYPTLVCSLLRFSQRHQFLFWIN